MKSGFQEQKKRLVEFEEKVDLVVRYLRKFNTVNLPDLEELIWGNGNHKMEAPGPEDEVLLHGESGRKIRAITVNQKMLVEEGADNDLLIAVGPAGTGKTYTAIAMAVKALKEKQVRRIILTRPAVEAGEKLGFLPGDFKEKLDPYLQPLYDALRDMIPAKKADPVHGGRNHPDCSAGLHEGQDPGSCICDPG